MAPKKAPKAAAPKKSPKARRTPQEKAAALIAGLNEELEKKVAALRARHAARLSKMAEGARFEVEALEAARAALGA